MMICTMVFAYQRRVTWLMTVACLLLAPGSAVGQSRVALVTLGNVQKIVVALELATAELSQNPKVVLLERDLIRTVLAEQQFSLGAGTLDEGALSVGKLLKAEVLVVCEQISDDRSIRCVAYEATTGCRLHDISHASPKLPEIATLVAQATQAAIAKRERFELDSLRLISFHGSRNVDVPTAQLQRLAKIQERIEQQFASSPQFAVLERARLRFINNENRLPSVQQHAHLLASAANVVMQFASTDQQSDIEVTLVLRGKNPKEDQSFRAVISDLSDDMPIRKLLERVVEAISTRQGKVSQQQMVQSNESQRLKEAKKLRTEAKRLMKAERWEDAVMFSEAAYALEPEGFDDLKKLISLLDSYARSLLKPIHQVYNRTDYKPEADEDVWREVLRLLDYQVDVIRLLHHRRKHEPRWHLVVGNNIVGIGSFVHQSFSMIHPGAIPEVAELAKTYSAKYIQVLDDEIGQYVQQQVKTPDEAARCIPMCFPRFFSGTAKQCGRWPQLTIEHYDLWNDILQKKGWDTDNPAHGKANYNLLRVLEFSNHQMKQFNARDLGSIRKRVAALTKNPSEVVRIPAMQRLLDIDCWYGELKDPAEIVRRIEPLIDELVLMATRPLPPDPKNDWRYRVRLPDGGLFPGDNRREKIINTMLSILQRVPTAAHRNRVTKATFNKLIGIGVFSPMVFERILPGVVMGGMKQDTTNFPDRIAQYKQTLVHLKSCQENFPQGDYDQLVAYVTTRMARERALLERHRGTFKGLKLWSSIQMLAGKANWPEKPSSDTPQVVGYAVRGKDLIYLLQSPIGSGTTFHLDVVKHRLNRNKASKKINQLKTEGTYADLTREQRNFVDKIQDQTENSSPKRVVCDDHNLYWGRKGHGIVILPLNGDEPSLLNEKSGLPSNFVRCLAATEGKVYAWIGRPKKELLLVSYEPKSKKIEVLVSSERITKQHPLDGQQPVAVHILYYDQPRERLVFSMGKSLWSWNLTTQKAIELLDLSFDSDFNTPKHELFLRNVVAIPHKNTLLVNQGCEYWAVNLNDDSVQKLPKTGHPAIRPFRHPATAWHDNNLWLRSLWGVYNHHTNQFHPLELLIQDVDPPWWWQPWSEVVDQGHRCIIWDKHHLWLAKLTN